jgi:methionyl aminopeptidase
MENNEQLLSDIRSAAKIVSEVLMELESLTCPDASLALLNELAERRIIEMGGTSAFKGYQPTWAKNPFKSACCMSVDYEVCHGSPDRGLFMMEGQIIKYDLGVKYGIGHGDACLTVAVGEISDRKKRLMRYAKEAMMVGIKKVHAGVKVSEIGRAIEQFSVRRGYNVIKEYAGHGIGRELHEDPMIPNIYRREDEDIILQAGQVICIEPMLTPGNGFTAIWPEDHWMAFCPDGQPVAQYEHEILVTDKGSEILTSHL